MPYRGLALLLAIASVAGACNGPTASAPDGGAAPDGGDGKPFSGDLFLFVTTVTGKVLVVDSKTGGVVSTVPVTHQAVHGVGWDPDRRLLFAPDPSGQRVVEMLLSPDLRSYELHGEYLLRDLPYFLSMSPDRRVVATGSSTSNGGSGGVGYASFIDTVAQRVAAEYKFTSPGRIAYDPDSKFAYVVQQESQIPVVDLAAFQQVDVYTNQALVGYKGAGGPHPAVRARDRLLCTPNLDRFSITCLPLDDPDRQRVITMPKGEMPHDLFFDTETGYLWVQTQAMEPSAGNEAANVNIPTFVHVFDLDTGRDVTTPFSWKYAVWHVAVGVDRRAYVSGSWGTLVVFDARTYQKLDEFKLSDGPQPVMTVNFHAVPR